LKSKTGFKILSMMLSLFTICWASSALAQMGKKGQFADFIKHFDKDGDGKVSKQEFTGTQDHFTSLDKNNDGFIDQNEKPAAGKSIDQSIKGAAKGGNMIQNLDKNGDGKISKDEFAGPAEVFTTLDKNKDGFIDQNEKPPAPMGKGGNMRQNADKNGDGKLSKDEFAGPAEVFTTLDKNKDGFIDQDEKPNAPLIKGVTKGGMMQNPDKNGDGKISKDEFAGPAEVFTTLDKNKDGFIDQNEKPAAPMGHSIKGEAKSGAMIQNRDKNGDGKLSKDEFAGPAEVFTTLDKNKDGFIDQNEKPAAPMSKERK